MFLETKIDTVIAIQQYTVTITFGIAVIAVFIDHVVININREKAITNQKYNAKIKRIDYAAKAIFITSILIVGLMFFSLIFTQPLLNSAKSHGMARNSETEKYGLTIGQIRDFNQKNPVETKINPKDFDTLREKIIIIYRYDCEDCHKLYPTLAALEKTPDLDVKYLSSRTETGLAFKEYFNPELVGVPSGIYIRKDGVPVTLELYEKDPISQAVIFSQKNWERLLNIREQDLK